MDRQFSNNGMCQVPEVPLFIIFGVCVNNVLCVFKQIFACSL